MAGRDLRTLHNVEEDRAAVVLQIVGPKVENQLIVGDCPMFKKPRWTDWFAILGILVILGMIGWNRLEEWREKRRYEDRIAAFRPELVQPLILPADRVVAGESLSGRWETVAPNKHFGSTIVFDLSEDVADRRYDVEFTTKTCTWHHSSQRTAELREGVVVLDRPIAEAIGPVFRQLHCVRVGGRRALIPDVRSNDMAALLAAIENAESRNEWSDLQWLAYLRED